MAKENDKKFLTLGTVVKIDASGMVILDNGTRSHTKAEIFDVLKKDLQTGEIVVEKGKSLSDNDMTKTISELTKENEVLKAQNEELRAELENLKATSSETERAE